MEEPSVLDYLKSIINPWNTTKIKIPEFKAQNDEIPLGSLSEHDKALTQNKNDEHQMVMRDEGAADDDKEESTKGTLVDSKFPWQIIVSVFLAIVAQRMLEPPNRHLNVSIVFYFLSAITIVWYLVKNSTYPTLETNQLSFGPFQFRKTNFILSLAFGAISFFAFGNHLFSTLTVFFWFMSIIFGISAFWQTTNWKESFRGKAKNFLKNLSINFRISPWSILVFASMALVLFFRFYHLDQVPGEMFSDHAEKLIDVADVLNGNYWTFFPRNTGREAVQMYLTAAVSLIFGTGLSFMSLKIGTALAGALTVPYIYLLGKEVGNRWVGLFALLFSGIAYWPNVISRVGLRFPLYPLFTAPVLYYLVRGFRRSNFNDIVISGLLLGVGLHGYSPIRLLPFVITLAFSLYLIHPQSKGKRKTILFSFLVFAFIAFLVFIPLLRYWIDDPMMFSYRSMTRLGTIERGYPGSVTTIFLTNLWKSSTMFFWDNGGIWVHSVTGRPALSVVSAALLFLGILLVSVRYLRNRNWIDLFLLTSIPLLMMPSILSLAFPEENPSLNRTGGAIIPVFILVAIASEFILKNIATYRKWSGKVLATLLGLMLLLISANQDFDLVFRRFNQQFIYSVWNTSEIGSVIRSYVDSSIGEKDTAYVVPFPHWVDTRLVGINAGYPDKDYALWPDQFVETDADQGAKLFIIKPEDQDSILDLLNLYPQSSYWLYPSKIPGKEFWVFMVPPEPTMEGVSAPPTP